MNILFVGTGVVGQRHIRNLKLKFKNINFFTIKGNHSKKIFSDKKGHLKGNVNSKYNLEPINISDVNKNIKINAAFICLPHHLHSKFLYKLFRKKVHVFLEKPGGANANDLKLLKTINKINKKDKLKIMLGYHLRFHPLIHKLKKLILKKKVGKILNVLVQNGEHIADYRSYQKYWKIYHSKKNKGGGVILNQIHEIDYLMYLFQNYKFKIMNTFNNKFSKAKIDTEDTLSSNFILSNSKEKFIVTLLLNSYERPKHRSIKIIGSKGKIIGDLSKNTLETFRYEIFNNEMMRSKKIARKNINFKLDRNDLFKNEIYYFINCIKKNKPINYNYGLAKSIKNLEITLKLKK